MTANTFSARDTQRIGAAVRAHETRQVPDLPPPPGGPSRAILWAKVTTAWKPNQANPNLVPVEYIYADGTAWTPPSGVSAAFEIYVSWPPAAKPTSPILASVLALDAIVPFVPFGLEYNTESWGLLATMVPDPASIPAVITANGGSGSYTVELLTMALASYSPAVTVTATEINGRASIANGTKIHLATDGTDFIFSGGNCCSCCGCYYRARWYGGECNPAVDPLDGCTECPDGGYCIIPEPGLDMIFQFVCEETSSGSAIYTDPAIPASITVTYLAGVYTVTLIYGDGCYDGEAGAFRGTFEGACLPDSIELLPIAPDDRRCTGTITIEFAKIYCPDRPCPCLNNCYLIEVFGGDPDLYCDNCATEESGLLTFGSCDSPWLTNDGWGMAGLAFRGPTDTGWPEPSNTLIPIGSFYFNWASPILGDCYTGASDMQWVAPISTVGPTGCPVEGEYTLYPANEDDAIYCEMTNTKTVRITQVACCTEIADGSEPTYYLSFDSVLTWQSDVDGDMADCDGNGGGGNTVEECNSTDTYTELVGDTVVGDDVCSYFFVHAGNCWLLANGINIYGTDGEWVLQFPTAHDFYLGNVGTVKVGGLTPVGIYPAIAICYNDGTNAFRLDITNIAITA